MNDVISTAIQGVVAVLVAWIGYRGAVLLRDIKRTGAETHSLVNGQHGASLKFGAEVSRWKADKTKKPEDEHAALLAEKLNREHESNQEKLDAVKERK